MLARVLWYCYELSRNQWLEQSELKRLQEDRLKAILRHAYNNVPFYRKHLDSACIKPEDIQSAEDLTKLPFTTKQQILAGMPDQSIARGYDINDCVRMSTSGTSGGPMLAFRDKRFWDYCVANRHYRRTRALGLVPGSKVMEIEYHRPDAVHNNSNEDRMGALDQRSRGRQSLGPSVSLFRFFYKKVYIAYTGEEIISDVISYKPTIIYACPSYLRLLAETIADKGISDIHPKALISWGEVLDEPTREFLGSSLTCDVFDTYGANEVGPVASQCIRREGFHIAADSLILEIIRDGKSVDPGETGEIVVTELLNYAMPMIRYRVGDIGILSDQGCSCGRSFPLLKSVEGRLIDCFTLPDGRIVTPKSIQSAIQATPGVSRYQAVQHDVRRMTIELMRKEGDPEVTVGELVERCHGLLGDEIEIDVLIGDRKNLKAKFRPVISKLTGSVEPRWTKPRR